MSKANVWTVANVSKGSPRTQMVLHKSIGGKTISRTIHLHSFDNGLRYVGQKKNFTEIVDYPDQDLAINKVRIRRGNTTEALNV